jgi:hypothetical protein
MKKFKTWLHLTTLLACSLIMTATTTSEWDVIGEKTFDLTSDFVEFTLGEKADMYQAIKFKVLHHTVFFHEVSIQYKDGNTEVKELKQKIKAGADSKVVDLTGNTREITKLKFGYKTNPKASERPTLVILGR